MWKIESESAAIIPCKDHICATGRTWYSSALESSCLPALFGRWFNASSGGPRHSFVYSTNSQPACVVCLLFALIVISTSLPRYHHHVIPTHYASRTTSLNYLASTFFTPMYGSVSPNISDLARMHRSHPIVFRLL